MRHLYLLVFLTSSLLLPAKEKNPKPAAPSTRAGIKTPGIQIPYARLKAESQFALESPAAFLANLDQFYVGLPSQSSLARIDAKTNKLADPISGIAKPCGTILSAFKDLWTADCGKSSVLRLDAKTGKVLATLDIGAGPLLATADSIWLLADTKTTLLRLDPKDNSIVAEIRLGPACNSMSFGADSLWITCPKDNRLLRLDPKTNLVTKRIETALEPIAAVHGENHVFVLGAKDGKISKVDPKTDKVVETIDTAVPGVTGTLAYSDGTLWVSQEGFPLTRIETKSGKVLQQFYGEGGGLLQFAAGSLWIGSSTKPGLARIDPKRVALTLPE